jgi:hypothetical protein
MRSPQQGAKFFNRWMLDKNHRILRRLRTFAVAVECSSTQGYAIRRCYVFVYSYFPIGPTITVTRLTEGDDVVVAEGSVRTQRKDGTFLNLAFCDVFEMEASKIRRLISYLMETK